MNDGRRMKCSSTAEEKSELLKITQNKLKINRLKRSPKSTQTQKADFTSCRAETDFKTPTRVPKAGFRGSVTDESPNNDYELQHEIIWDPTSPVTPVRNGRGRRRTAVFKTVDISDIVNRIAPKNKRPEEAESSLLQWIGDTAVPCTPEIPEPRTRSKPTRQNPVEDLLKLAKRFDFNMIQQEEAHLRKKTQSFTESMHEDKDLFFYENDPPASLQTHSEAERPVDLEDTKTNTDNLGLLQEMDDLDLLFESSTHQLSGGLSPGPSALSQDVAKFTPPCAAARADSANSCGVTQVRRASEANTVRACVTAQVLGTIKQMGAADDFEDDWNNDDLMELFSAPQHSSTQKQTNKTSSLVNAVYCDEESKSGAMQMLNRKSESFERGQHWNKTTGNENSKQSGFQSSNNLKTQLFSSIKVPLMVHGSHSVSKINSQFKKPVEIQRTPANNSSAPCYDATRKVQSVTTTSLVSRSDPNQFVPSGTIVTTPSIRFSEEKENHPLVEDDVLDLDSIFASDDIWDDGADDDDLFCEVCEKVEESIAESPPKAFLSKPTPMSRCSSTSQTTSGKCDNMIVHPSTSNAPVHNRSAAGSRAPSSTQALPGTQNNNTSRKYKFTHVKNNKGTGSAAYNAASQVSKITTATTIQSFQRIEDKEFIKPHNTFNAAATISKDVSTVAVTRCSDAEIERKKQQAMERRRLRMLANQNLQAPV